MTDRASRRVPERRIVDTPTAPAAIGPYSQAVGVGPLVFLSGQIPLDPVSGELVDGGIAEQARQVFRNLAAVAEAAGGSLADAARLTIYLVDLAEFQTVNGVMTEFFTAPFPARATVGVVALPRNAAVEVDAILVLDRSA